MGWYGLGPGLGPLSLDLLDLMPDLGPDLDLTWDLDLSLTINIDYVLTELDYSMSFLWTILNLSYSLSFLWDPSFMPKSYRVGWCQSLCVGP